MLIALLHLQYSSSFHKITQSLELSTNIHAYPTKILEQIKSGFGVDSNLPSRVTLYAIDTSSIMSKLY